MDCNNCKIKSACIRCGIYEEYSKLDDCEFFYPTENKKPKEGEQPKPNKFSNFQPVSEIKPLTVKETNRRRNEILKQLEEA